MDKIIEKKTNEDIKKKLAVSLKQFSFNRTKKSYYTLLKNDRIEFIHLHKFSFDSSFRVHVGIRVLSDSYENVVLNGIDSDSFRPNLILGSDKMRSL